MDTASKSKKNLFEKLVEIRKKVSVLRKENKNKHQDYWYVSSSQAVLSVREKMDELGVLLHMEITGKELHFYKSGKLQRGPVIHVELNLKYTWINAENPTEKISIPWYTQGTDNSERCVGKALTYGEKYFILKFFQIATDDDDPDNSKNEPSQPQRKEWKKNNNYQANTQTQKRQQQAPATTPSNGNGKWMSQIVSDDKLPKEWKGQSITFMRLATDINLETITESGNKIIGRSLVHIWANDKHDAKKATAARALLEATKEQWNKEKEKANQVEGEPKQEKQAEQQVEEDKPKPDQESNEKETKQAQETEEIEEEIDWDYVESEISEREAEEKALCKMFPEPGETNIPAK